MTALDEHILRIRESTMSSLPAPQQPLTRFPNPDGALALQQPPVRFSNPEVAPAPRNASAWRFPWRAARRKVPQPVSTHARDDVAARTAREVSHDRAGNNENKCPICLDDLGAMGWSVGCPVCHVEIHEGCHKLWRLESGR